MMALEHSITDEAKDFLTRLLELFPTLFDHSAEDVYRTVQNGLSDGSKGSMRIEALREMLKNGSKGLAAFRMDHFRWIMVKGFFNAYGNTTDNLVAFTQYWETWKAEQS